MDKQTEKFSQVQKLTEDQAKTEQSVKVVVSKSPLDKPHVEFIRPDVSCYDAVHKFLSDICVYNNENIVLELNGKPLQESDHSRILKHDDLLVVAVRPADPLSLGTLITTALISAAVSVVAGVISYNLFKPDEPDAQDDDRVSAISGMRNRSRPYEPVRAVLGKRQIAPDYWAKSYTYRRGDDEWFRALLCVGYGPLKIEDMKVGETPFEDLEGKIAVLDYYENTDITTVKELWPDDVVEDSPAITLLKGDTASRTTAVNPDKISLEFLLPRGMAKGSSMNASSIQHQYTTNESPSRNINILRLFRGGVVAPTGSGTSGTKFRPLPYALIQINDGSYRLCQGGEGDRNPWDRTDGHGVTQFDTIFGGRNNRSILRRSWTFPSEAIVKVEGTGNNRLMHIDMDVLDGTPRFIWERTGTDDDGDGIYEIVQDGTYTKDSPLAAIAFASSRTRQRRLDFEYHPIGETDGQTISTETVKLYPNETPDDASNISEWNWTKFRTVRNLTDAQFRNLIGYAKPELEYLDGTTPVSVGNFRPVIIALELKATDQLSGALDNFNVVATTAVPNDWNYDWRRMIELNQNQLHPTENPAEVYRWLLQGPITDAPNGNERVDLEELLDWKDYCDEPYITGEYDGPQWRVSYEAIQQQTIQELLNKVAYTGRAEFAYTDRGQYGVLQKTRRDVPVQIITPKNSWDFEAARVFPEIDDGIKFKFDNELEEYQEDEDVFYDPRVENRRGRFKGQTIQGVPSRDIAYRIARFSYYEEAFQREIYKASMDVEGMVMKRGSLAYLQNDVIDVGLGAGRITRIFDPIYSNDETILSNSDMLIILTNGGIGLDESINLEIGGTYGIYARKSNGEFTDVEQTLYSDAIEGGVFLINPSDYDFGDFAAYGQLDQEVAVVQVIAMDFGEDNVVRLTFVNYDDRLYDIDESDEDPIPEFNTNLTERIEFQIPNPPQLTLPDNLGSVDIATQQFYLDLEYESQFENSTDLFTFQVRTAVPEGDPLLDEEFDDRLLSLEPEYDDEPWEFAGSIPSQETQFVYQGVERGTGYRVRARSRSQNGDFSTYSIPVNVVIPLSFPPNNVENLQFKDTVDGIILSWNKVNDPDFADYEIRTNTNVGEEDGLIDNVAGVKINVGYNDEPVTYYVYARTVFDAYSLQAAETNVPSFYVPTIPTIRSQSDSIAGTRIRWNPIAASEFFKSEYVDFYEIRTDTNVGDDEGLVTTTSEQSTNIGFVNGQSLITYYVYAVSVGGYYGDPLITTPDNPDSADSFKPINLLGVPIDNSASLDWQDPPNITYPVKFYEVEQRAPGRVEPKPIGRFNSTYANIVEREGGNYTFFVRTVDEGFNRSEFVSVALRIFDPSDFVLFYDQEADLALGTTQNAYIDNTISDAVVYGPILDTKTLQDTIDEAATASGVTAPTFQNKLDSVGPYLTQFTPTSVDGQSQYQQVFDFFDGQEQEGLFLNNTSITLSLNSTQLSEVSDANIRTFIERSEDGITWLGISEGTQVFVDEPFRFARVSVYFDTNGVTDGQPFARLENLNVAADVKQITDQGEADIVGATLENGDPNPDFPTEISFRRVRDDAGELQNYFTDVLSVNGTVEEFDPSDLQNPERVTEILSNGKILNKGEIVTIKTEFEYREDPNDPSSPVVLDRFRAYAQGPDGRFIPARISWIARGIANIID